MLILLLTNHWADLHVTLHTPSPEASPTNPWLFSWNDNWQGHVLLRVWIRVLYEFTNEGVDQTTRTSKLQKNYNFLGHSFCLFHNLKCTSTSYFMCLISRSLARQSPISVSHKVRTLTYSLWIYSEITRNRSAGNISRIISKIFSFFCISLC